MWTSQSHRKLVSFYRRVAPSIYGWQPIAKLCPELPEGATFRRNFFQIGPQAW